MSTTPPPPNTVPGPDLTHARVHHSGQGPGLPKMPHTTPVVAPVVALLAASKPIAFNINFARITGDTKAALLLSQLVYWTRRGADVLDNDGWIFKTREDWEAEIGLSKHEQITARNILTGLGLMEEARTGAPARNCYRVMPAVLGAHLAQLVRTEPVQWSLLDMRTDSQDMRVMLGRQFAFYKVLMQVTTTCTSAIYLSKALAIQRRFADRQPQQSKNGPSQTLPWDTEWFRMAVDSTQADTGLSTSQQRDAKHKLCQIGLLHEAMMTHPRKQLYLRIDMQMLNKLLAGASQKTARQNRATAVELERGKRFTNNQSEWLTVNHSPQDEVKPLPQKIEGGEIMGERFSTNQSECIRRGHSLQDEVKPLPQKIEGGEIMGGRFSNNQSEWMAVNHSPQGEVKPLPQKHEPRIAEQHDGLNDPSSPAACQNRTTRMADSDKLDVRIPQGRWPVLARPMAGFSTPSCPVLTGLHAGASRAGQDYKEDYIKTTTTAQDPPKVDADPPNPGILTSKAVIEVGGEKAGSTDSAGPTSAAVVVVSSFKPDEPVLDGSWVWPDQLTQVEQVQGTRILNSLAKTGQLEDAQNILDELSGWIATGGVKSNLSYLRKLVETHQSTPGGLVYERGPDVRLRRERLAAVANRSLSDGVAVASKGPIKSLIDGVEGDGAAGTVVLTDAAKSGLAKARELLANYKKGST